MPMAIRSQNKGKTKADRTYPHFPNVGDFDSVGQYNEAVKGYWNAIDAYRRMAVEFYNEIEQEAADGH